MQATPPFVGRRQHLQQLEECVQAALNGQPRVVLIAGETGIGKTRLLREVQELARHSGALACYGRAYEDLRLPYLMFVEAWRAQLAQLPPELEPSLTVSVEVISKALQRQRSPAPVVPLALSDQANQEKLRLLVPVTRAMLALAQHYPTLLVLDDLHWADQRSLELLGHLVFTMTDTAAQEPVPLLIVGTYRPEEPGEHLRRLLARLQRETLCQTIALAGLEEADIRELLRGLGLLRPSHQLVTILVAATRGNPLFIQEMVRYLQQREALREYGGYVVTTSAAADLQLPAQVMGVLTARLQDLSPACRRLLTLVACLGDHCALPVLSAVSGLDEEQLLDLLEVGMSQHLIVNEGQTFQFTHPLIRHVCYSEPSRIRRQRLHQQIAQALERLYAEHVDRHILEIAHHLIRAGPAAAVHEVLRYARQAGDQAFAVSAWGEAAHYYEAALAAAESTAHLTVQERAILHYRAGFARYRDMDAGPCLDHYDKAIVAYRLVGDAPGLAQVLIEKTRLHYTLASVPFGTLIDMRPLEETLEALGEHEPGLRGRIAAVMAEAYWTARQTDQAEAVAQHALDIGQHLADDQLCTQASFALALAHMQRTHVQEALQTWQDSLTYARRTADLWLQSWPLQRIPGALALLGRLDEAEALALEACDVTRQTQDWGYYSGVLSYLASVAVTRGAFAVAEQRVQETMLMVSRSHYPWGGYRSLLARACMYALRGYWTEAEAALDRLMEPGQVFETPWPVMQVFVQVLRRWLQVYAQATDEAGLEPLAAALLQAVGSDTYSLAPLCALVELGDLLATPTVTERPYQALMRVVERGVLFSSGWVYLLPRVLGVAATLQQQWETAAAHFQAALSAAHRTDARPELGRTYLDYARMLVARGRMSDQRRAIDLAQQARAIFADLDMHPFAQRTAELIEVLQVPLLLGRRQRRGYVDRLSPREVAVLRHMARSYTNFLG
jgi:tetratricopeptide (TPR) repeat protein